jgi:hypothetical protein
VVRPGVPGHTQWLIGEVKRLRGQERVLQAGLEQIAETGNFRLASKVLQLEMFSLDDKEGIPRRLERRAITCRAAVAGCPRCQA